jgi:hypothetical protein
VTPRLSQDELAHEDASCRKGITFTLTGADPTTRSKSLTLIDR